MVWIDFVICLLFGILGVHKFREKRIGLGVLYLLTGGLFGFGWIVDCVRYLLTAISSAKSGKTENDVTPETQLARGKGRKILFWVITLLLGLIGFAYFPNLAGILALVAALLVAAIEKWKPDFDESNEVMKFVYAYKSFIFEYYKQSTAINIFKKFIRQIVIL
jgi:TM2 domain-containing membrane protein YozV